MHPLPPPPYINTTEDDATAPPLPAAAAAAAATPRQTAAMNEIMSNGISLQSTTKYAGQNATFAICCYHSIELRDDLLEPWFIEEVSLQATEFAKQQHAKNYCVKMSPHDDNRQFILSNLTFEQFSDFVTQRKARRGKGRGLSMSLGNASYEQSQSALKHLFRMSKYAMQTNFFNHLKQFTKGIRRHVADKKVLEGDVTMVGKKKMGFNVYKKICEKFLQEGGEEFIFAHAFVTLEWNLMGTIRKCCERTHFALSLGC